MKGLATVSLAAATLLLSATMMNGAVAQETKADKAAPQATTKVIMENARVRVQEVTYPPGAVNTAVSSSSMRVVRALSGGTLQRIYADGKKEDVTWKTDEVKINEASPAYTAKNTGKGTVKLFVVVLK